MNYKRILCFAIFGFISFFSILATAQTEVEQWGRFEQVFKGPSSGNPFEEVNFQANFWLDGSKEKTLVSGFYDGDGQYIIRFMPSEVGTWHYQTKSNSSSLSGKKGTFQSVPAKDNKGIVRIKDWHSFEYTNGEVYHPVGTTAYAWTHMPLGIQEETLASLEEAKFNKIRMCVFPKNYNLCQEEPELYPFLVKEKSKERVTFDLSRFDPKYFQHLEKRLDELNALGIEADLILFHPYDKGRWGFDSMPEETNLAYIRYICARLSSFNNIWWSLANEYDYVKSKTEDDWMRLIKEVRASDPYSHLCSIHGSTAKYFPYWMEELTHASIQDEAPVEDYGRAATLRNIYRKPVVMDEVCYEGNLESRWGRLSGAEMLHRMWQGLLGGIYVTHGECYMYNSPSNTIFWAKGGKWRGESWKRIQFTREIIDQLPNSLQMADVSRDHFTATAGENYYLVYFGKEMKDQWTFNLPNKNADYNNVKQGTKFKVEIIDTWNMTIRPVDDIFEVGAVNDYRVYDIKHKNIRLPLQPYIMLRITELK